MTKKELREKYKEKRQKLNASSREAFSLAIANNALRLPLWEKTTYALFLSIERQREVNTEFLLHILQGKDKNVALSKSNFETYQMQHFLLTDNTKIATNKWGIPEPVGGIEIIPEQIEVVFIPLLAFDQLGNRLGYGKGFYDRFLAQCAPTTLKVGLSFFDAEPQKIPVHTNDIPLDYCITPQQTYSFQGTP